jgi:hypothetical protein
VDRLDRTLSLAFDRTARLDEHRVPASHDFGFALHRRLTTKLHSTTPTISGGSKKRARSCPVLAHPRRRVTRGRRRLPGRRLSGSCTQPRPRRTPKCARLCGLLRSGGPVYAECGGLMYLTTAIETLSGERHRMVGSPPAPLSCTASFELWLRGSRDPGAHYPRTRGHSVPRASVPVFRADADPNCVHRLSYAAAPRREQASREGYGVGNVLASYVHAHWASNPGSCPSSWRAAHACGRSKTVSAALALCVRRVTISDREKAFFVVPGEGRAPAAGRSRRVVDAEHVAWVEVSNGEPGPAVDARVPRRSPASRGARPRGRTLDELQPPSRADLSATEGGIMARFHRDRRARQRLCVPETSVPGPAAGPSTCSSTSTCP